MEETNFKKWGWWAIGAVIVVAVVAIGVIVAQPKSDSGDDGGDENTELVEDGGKNEEKTDEAVSVDNGASELPQSGPKEDLAAIFLAGFAGYAISLAITTVYRAKKEKLEEV